MNINNCLNKSFNYKSDNVETGMSGVRRSKYPGIVFKFYYKRWILRNLWRNTKSKNEVNISNGVSTFLIRYLDNPFLISSFLVRLIAFFFSLLLNRWYQRINLPSNVRWEFLLGFNYTNLSLSVLWKAF